MQDILKFVSNFEKKNKIFCDKKRSRVYELKKENFEDIELRPSKRKIYAVDGGSSIIYDGGSRTIAKIKIASVGFSQEKKILEEVAESVVGSVMSNDCIQIKTNPKNLFPNENLPLSKIDEVQNTVRSAMEWQQLLELSKTCEEGSILLADSALTSTSKQDRKLLENLQKETKNKNIILMGVCKTSRLRTNTGRSLIGYLNQLSDKGSWYYVPVFESENENYFGKTFIVKFHPKSRFCYRVDLEKSVAQELSNEKLKEIFGTVAYYASDPELIGYPYPLLKADKLARLREDEKLKGNQNVLMLSEKMGLSSIKFDENSNNMHEFLDKRAYR